MKLIATVILAGTAMAIGTAASSAPFLLSPAGKWNVDYRPEGCALQRAYGTKQEPVTLGFRPMPMSNGLRITIVRPASTRFGDAGSAEVSIGDSPPVRAHFEQGRMTDKPLQLTYVYLSRSELGPLDGARSLTVKAGERLHATFALDNMALARKALDTCVHELLKSWGMDEATLAAIATPPIVVKGMEPFVKHTDYPEAAIRANEEGTSAVRFMVGTDGRARDCKVVESSGSARLDDVTCRLVTERARYQPAKDRDGKPLPSLSYTAIHWRLP